MMTRHNAGGYNSDQVELTEEYATKEDCLRACYDNKVKVNPDVNGIVWRVQDKRCFCKKNFKRETHLDQAFWASEIQVAQASNAIQTTSKKAN